MRVEPYLNLSGRCEEALEFYKTAVNAKPVIVLRMKDSPEPHSQPLPEGWSEKIMHCGFMIGHTLVMATDGMAGENEVISGVSLSITADDEAQAHRMFDALSAGGQVLMPISPTFWSPCFGMCTDKFGVSWMIGIDGNFQA